MPERLNGHDWKSCDGRKLVRGFESLSLRPRPHCRLVDVPKTRTVRDLVIGSELTFTDHGEHQLKGIPDRWAIYSA